jgi:hypothetical protein
LTLFYDQREQIHTVKDALQCISIPSSVQVTSPTRPGVTLDASQQVLIDTVPPILVLHMKRFLYDTKVNGVVKIGKQVSFEPELEIGSDIMAKKGPQPTKYKLFGGKCLIHFLAIVLCSHRRLFYISIVPPRLVGFRGALHSRRAAFQSRPRCEAAR